MSLAVTQFNINAGVVFAESETVTGFGSLAIGPLTTSFSLAGINLATFNLLFAAQYSLVNIATQAFDLANFTDLAGNTGIALGHALSIAVFPTGGPVALAPDNASNPFTWFFGGSTQSITIPASGVFIFSNPITATGTTVASGSASKMTLTSSLSPGITTVTVYVFGSST